MDIEELKELYDENRELGYVAIIFASIIFGVFIDFSLDWYLDERTPRGLATVIISITGLCLCILAIYTEKAEEAKYNAYTASADLEELEEVREKAETATKQLQEEQELATKQAKELTKEKQDSKRYLEEIQKLKDDKAKAEAIYTKDSELLTKAIAENAKANNDLSKAKEEIQKLKGELSKASSLSPYLSFFDSYKAYIDAGSEGRKATASGDEEWKAKASEAIKEAKKDKDKKFEQIINQQS